jgi:hypothetical protein
LGNLVVVWYVFPRFGTLCEEKSGNPADMYPTKCSQLHLSQLNIYFPNMLML